MSKPRSFFYYRTIPGEMELRLKGCSRETELILHRLMRVYFAREKDIPATPEKVSAIVNFTVDEVRGAWEELSELVDLGGSDVRIPWFDDEVDQARRRSEQARQNAEKRWKEGK